MPFVGLRLSQAWADRLQDLVDGYTEEIAARIGTTEIGAARAALVQRAATLSIECERAEHEFATRGSASPAAISAYSRASGNLRRLLEALEIGVKPRKVA